MGSSMRELPEHVQNSLRQGHFDLSHRDIIIKLINDWNQTRMDIFEIREPEESSVEFYGVVRFYHQDSQQRVSTKCIRVASSATTQDVVETLAQKFRPDMKMLTTPNYALYEVHHDRSRKLDWDERPIIVQLLWNQDMKEGRLTLRNEDDPLPIKLFSQQEKKTELSDDSDHDYNEQEVAAPHERQDSKSTITKLTRKLTSRKKKRNSEAAKLRRASMKTGNTPFNVENASLVAQQVYKEKPESNFTRTLSNPEVVLRRQREQKVAQRLQKESRNLKIYAAGINDALPFVNLTVSPVQTAKQVIQAVLEKYSIPIEEYESFSLVKLEFSPDLDERYLSATPDRLQQVQVRQEVLSLHHRPLAKLTEYEKTQRSQMNMDVCCAFQIRQIELYPEDVRNGNSSFREEPQSFDPSITPILLEYREYFKKILWGVF